MTEHGIDWGVVAIMTTVMMAGLGALFGAIKWLMDRYTEALNKRFEAIESAGGGRDREIQNLREAILLLRAELPERYVQRDDWIRFAGSIDRKLEVLRDRLEDLREGQDEFRGRKGHPTRD